MSYGDCEVAAVLFTALDHGIRRPRNYTSWCKTPCTANDTGTQTNVRGVLIACGHSRTFDCTFNLRFSPTSIVLYFEVKSKNMIFYLFETFNIRFCIR